MATGDQNDQQNRLLSIIPPWFGDSFPLLSAILNAFAGVQAFLYDLITFARMQTRIATASGGWLDLIAYDFFGAGLVRGINQSDASFRNAILINLFRERGTRNAIVKVVTDLTGTAPIIFEPSRIQDTGGYGAPVMGYGVAGRYGSFALPYQAFITAFRPANSGIPNVAGYGIPTGAYRTPSRAEYASLDMISGQVADADIFAAIDAVKPVGTIMWVRIGNAAPNVGPAPPASLFLNGGQLLLNGGNIRIVGWAL
jgi:hypothetical protein